MKTILICLLGNRDLQIHKDFADDPHPVIARYFVSHNDSPHLIINKAQRNHSEYTFLEAAQDVLDHYDELKDKVVFPMIDASIAHLEEKPTHLVFTTSKQTRIHHQDSYIFAEFASKLYQSRGYHIHIDLCTGNPTEMEPMLPYYNQLFDKWDKSDQKVIITNSGGTPTMRSASHFAGLFRGFQFIHVINSRAEDRRPFGEKVVSSTYQQQELRILCELILRNLQTYDYQGIINLLQPYIYPSRKPHLPMMDKLLRVNTISLNALNTYSLNTDLVDPSRPYRVRGVEAMELIYSNMIACFSKGAYADVIGRITRLEEAIGQYLMYRWMAKNGWLASDDSVITIKGKKKKKISFDKFLADKTAKIHLIEDKASNALIELNARKTKKDKPVWVFKHKPATAKKYSRVGDTAGGKYLFFFLFKSLGIHRELYDFLEKLNSGYNYQDNPLADLRNHSILGHGHNGVSKEDLERITGDFKQFCFQLSQLLEPVLGRPICNYFQQQNEQIEKLLNSDYYE